MASSRRFRAIARVTLLVTGTLLLAGLAALGLVRPLRQLHGQASTIRADYTRLACLERAVHRRVDRHDRVYVTPDVQYGQRLVEMATPWARVVPDQARSTVVLRVAAGDECAGARVVSTRR